jgi:hypothetical protein
MCTCKGARSDLLYPRTVENDQTFSHQPETPFCAITFPIGVITPSLKNLLYKAGASAPVQGAQRPSCQTSGTETRLVVLVGECDS